MIRPLLWKPVQGGWVRTAQPVLGDKVRTVVHYDPLHTPSRLRLGQMIGVIVGIKEIPRIMPGGVRGYLRVAWSSGSVSREEDRRLAVIQ